MGSAKHQLKDIYSGAFKYSYSNFPTLKNDLKFQELYKTEPQFMQVHDLALEIIGKCEKETKRINSCLTHKCPEMIVDFWSKIVKN